jgi:tetratricopeptide (TPR) repeat protein
LEKLARAVADAAEARRLSGSFALAPTVEGELRTQDSSIRRAVGAPWDYGPARQLLEQVVSQFPDYAPGHRALAAVLGLQDDVDGAVREMSVAIRISPTLHGALCERAAIYAMQKNYTAAEADLAKAKELGLPIPPEIEQMVRNRE